MTRASCHVRYEAPCQSALCAVVHYMFELTERTDVYCKLLFGNAGNS